MYFFIEHNNKPLCHICNESVKKKYYLKRHHKTKHENISKLEGIQRKEKIDKLKANLEKQQNIFNKGNVESVNNTKASYMKHETSYRLRVCKRVLNGTVCPERNKLRTSVILLVLLQDE